MKRILVLILGIMLAGCIAGCGESKVYKEAMATLEAGEYARAVEILDTIPEYEDVNGVRAHAEAVLEFQAALQLIIDENAEIDAICVSPQELLNSGRQPLDESKRTDLQVAIASLRELKKNTEDMPTETADVLAAAQKMSAPLNYATQKANIENAQKALEDSMQQMEQITNPTGDFIILRLRQIESIGEIQGVTEDYDPNGKLNKQGGYTSSTYFASLLIDQTAVYGTGIVDKGTDAGGCIEVFPTAEDAEARNAYLAAFDSAGMLSSGSHVVFGTIVIRTSDRLTATQQKELTAAIQEKLIELQ